MLFHEACGHGLEADLVGRDLKASVALKPVAVADVDGGSATTTLVNLLGTPLANETWRLRVGDLEHRHVAARAQPDPFHAPGARQVGHQPAQR